MSPIHSSVPFRSSQYIEKFWRVWGDLNSQNWRVSRKSWFTCKIKKITYKRGFHSDTGLKVDHRWVVEPEDKLRLTHVVPAREKIPVGCSQCFQSWKLPLSDFLGLSRQKWRNDAFNHGGWCIFTSKSYKIYLSLLWQTTWSVALGCFHCCMFK